MFSGCTVPRDSMEIKLGNSGFSTNKQKYWGSFSAMFTHRTVSLRLFLDVSEVPRCDLL